MTKLPETFAIIGAGPAGLGAARAFLKLGLDVELLERHDKVGGIWNMDNTGSPMYDTCNFISSRDFGGFLGYPMPSDYPAYPKWHQIRDYVHSFAQSYGLSERTITGAHVISAEPVDSPEGRFWRVTLASGETRDYRGIVAASGAQWKPYLPEIRGLSSFSGRVIHSSAYRDPSEFRGQRVLVVGAGNSGVDIVADAAHNADEAYLSTRRGYWFLPKVLFGAPVPDLLAGNVTPPVDSPLHGLEFADMVNMILQAVGHPTQFGLPAPDHDLGQSHPIVNNQVLHYLAHGLLHHRPDIAALDGRFVEFVDGTREEIDVVVFATGYDAYIDWLPEGTLEYHDGHPQFIAGALVDGQEGLYGVGTLHFAGNTFSVFEQVAQLAAHDAKAVVTGENSDNLRRIRESFRPDLTGGFPFLATRRNANQVHLPALYQAFDELRNTYGIDIPSFQDGAAYYDELRTHSNIPQG